MFEDLKSQVKAYIEPLLAELKIDLVELRIGIYGKTINIQIFVDKEGGGGINIDECSSINKQLVKYIDSGYLIHGDYTLEVSSPGLDRPLKTVKDFKRVLSRRIRFHLAEAVEGKIEHAGVLQEINVQTESLKVQTKDKEIEIPISKINKAIQSME